MDGWIKLYRKSIDSIVFQNEKLWKVWCWCLIRANHKSGHSEYFEGKEITLNPGQFITGRFQGAEQCNMKPSTFRDQISKLKALSNLDIKSDNKKTLITVVNWGLYQFNEAESDTKSDNKPTTNRHRQEVKNERKNNRGFSFDEIQYPVELENIEGFKETYKDWYEHRKQIKKPLTPKAVNLQLNQLTKFLEKGNNPIEVIEKSISNGWTGLFELSSGNGHKPKSETLELKA